MDDFMLPTIVCADCGRTSSLLWSAAGEYCPLCGSYDPYYAKEIQVVSISCEDCGMQVMVAAGHGHTRCTRCENRSHIDDTNEIPF